MDLTDAPTRGRRWTLLLMLSALLVLAGLLVGGWRLVRPALGDPAIDLTAYEELPDGLRVYAERGCGQDLAEDQPEVVVTDARVEITLRVERDLVPMICGDIYLEWEIDVALAEPLGDRVVLDGGCLEDGGSDDECRVTPRVGDR